MAIESGNQYINLSSAALEPHYPPDRRGGNFRNGHSPIYPNVHGDNANSSQRRDSNNTLNIPNNNHENPLIKENREPLLILRREDYLPQIERGSYVEEWEKAEATFSKYPGGTLHLGNRTKYYYRSGEHLSIRGEDVMDTCEYPWSKVTMDIAFNDRRDVGYPRVLELGFGLRLAANRTMEHLVAKGQGQYTAVELNNDVFDYSTDWAKKQFNKFKSMIPGSQPNIRIDLLKGDAEEWLRQLIQWKMKYDIILSDTFPIDPADKGINDLKHNPLIIQLMNLGAIFLSYSYTSHDTEIIAQGKVITTKQRNLLEPYFESIASQRVEIKPQPNHKFTWRNPRDEVESNLWLPAWPGGREEEHLVPQEILGVTYVKNPILDRVAA